MKLEGKQAAARWKAILLLSPIKLSLFCLIMGICLAARGGAMDCINFLQWGLIGMGLVLFLFFVTTLKCYRHDLDLTLILIAVVMIFALLALLGLMIAAFVNININGVNDDALPRYAEVDRRVRDYNLGDYGGRLRRRMADDPRYWAGISACLRHRHTCHGMRPLVRDPNTGEFFVEPSKKYVAPLSPIQSGCCKPPLSCAFTYVNQTTWTPTAPGVPTTNNTDDCSRWSNDQQTLCFQCDSCKAGVLADVQMAWSGPVIITTFIVILMLVSSCCLLRIMCSSDDYDRL